MTVLLGSDGGIKLTREKISTKEVSKISCIEQSAWRKTMLPRQRLMIVPDFLSLTLSGIFLVCIIRHAEIRALQSSRQSQDVFVGRMPISTNLEGNISAGIVEVSWIDRVQKPVRFMSRSGKKQPPFVSS